MAKGDSLSRRAPTREPGHSPALAGIRAGTPPWVPEDVGYDMLPEKVRAMIAEIIGPAYEQFVVRARDALEKTTGLTIVHLVWQEIVDQIDLARDYNNVGSVLNIVTPSRYPGNTLIPAGAAACSGRCPGGWRACFRPQRAARLRWPR